MFRFRGSKEKQEDAYNPYEERNIENPMKDWEVFVHLVKVALGIGTLSMPRAFLNAGYLVGPILTVFIAIVYTHCMYCLVHAAQALCVKAKVPILTFPEVFEAAFVYGPPKYQRFGIAGKRLVIASLIITYLGVSCVYLILVAENVRDFFNSNLNIRWFILMLAVPVTLLCFIPSLKHYVWISLIANLLMLAGIIICVIYIFNIIPDSKYGAFKPVGELMKIPAYWSITIFAEQITGHVLLLENQMKNPTHLVGKCGLLGWAITMITAIYLSLGILGYMAYRDETKPTITLNLPTEEILAKSARVVIGTSFFLSYGVMLFVALEVFSNLIQGKFEKRKFLGKCISKLTMPCVSIIFSIIMPSVILYFGLIGAILLTILGIAAPPILELLATYEDGYGKCNWKIIKCILICIFGLWTLVCGVFTSVLDIIHVYELHVK